MKELRASPRNLVFPAIVCGGLWAGSAWIAFGKGKPSVAMSIAVATSLLFAGLCFLFMRHRIILTADELVMESGFEKKRIKLKRVVTSQVSVDRQAPRLLEIYDRMPTETTKPMAVFPLTPFRKADVLELIKDPAIKLDR